MAQDVRAMTVEEIKKAVRERGKGLFVVFTSKAIGPGKGIKHGTGRGSIAMGIAEKLGGEYLSTGNLFREKAKEMKMDINQMQEYADEHPEFDVEIDKKAIEKVKDAVDKGKIIVADSNLLPYFVKDDIVRIVVDTDNNIRADRVLKGQRPGDMEFKNREDVLKKLDSRSKDEMTRYKEHPSPEYQSFDIHDQTFFDGTVSNDGTLEESLNQALEIIKKKVVQ